MGYFYKSKDSLCNQTLFSNTQYRYMYQAEHLGELS